MALEQGTFQVAQSVYPVPTGAISNLAQQDKPIYWLLQYFTQMLTSYAGDAWTEALGRSGLTDCPNIVGYSVPYNPLPYFQTISVPFPLLALYRVSGKSKEKTVSIQETISQLELQYYLPPVSAAQLEVLNPFFNSVFDIIKDRSQYKFDPHFMDGYLYGAQAGFSELSDLVNYSLIFGRKSTIDNELIFPGILMELTIKEINEPVPNQYDPTTNVTTEIDLVPDASATPNTIWNDYVDLSDDLTG